MLLAAEIVPRAVQSSLGACLIHIYAMQSNPETRRDEKRMPAYPASCLAAESNPSVYIHTNTEIHCCEEKFSCSVLLITKRKERGKAFSMVSTGFLHYNHWCLYTWSYFVLTCKTEGRDKNLPQHLCKAGGEKQHSKLWKHNSQLCCQLTVARHHSMSCWRDSLWIWC